MASFPRTIIPFEVSSLEIPGPLISKAQSGRVNIRSTQQIGRTWTEHYLINVRSVAGRGLLAAVDNFYRNGTIFTIDHRDHLTPMGTGGGSPLINQSPQLVPDPENFGVWTVVGTVARTSGQSDPYGGTAAYLLDSNVNGFDQVYEAITFSGAPTTKAAAVFLRAGTATQSAIAIYDAIAGVLRHRVRVTWTAGVPTLATESGAGTLYPVVPGTGGWYRLEFSADSITVANGHRWLIYPDWAAGLGTVYAFGANAWNTATPAGYIGPSNLTATGSNLYIDGATASVSNWLRAGDLVSVGGLASAYEVPTDTNSLAGGYVILPVNPPIFQGGAPADNAVVTITGVTMNACILEPPSYPSTSGIGADYGELQVRFSESL